MPRRSSPITCITGGQTLSISFLRSKTLILKADRNGWGAAVGGRKCEKRVNNTLKKRSTHSLFWLVSIDITHQILRETISVNLVPRAFL